MAVAHVLRTDDLARDYKGLLSDVLLSGRTVAPRGSEVREVTPLVLTLTDPSRCVVQRPGFNRGLMWAEIAMVTSGLYSAALYDAVAPPQSRALLTEFGAYGPRVSPQLVDVVRELTRDPDSRRAVVYVGRPDDLRQVQSLAETDMPCTMTWQFFVRDGALEMLVNMRSWDLVWGLSYDVPVFTSIQRALAAVLNVGVGSYVHVAGSAHVYDRHYDIVDKLKNVSVGEILPSPGAQLAARYRLENRGRYDPVAAFVFVHNETAFAIYDALSGNQPVDEWQEAVDLWREKIEKKEADRSHEV